MMKWLKLCVSCKMVRAVKGTQGRCRVCAHKLDVHGMSRGRV